ncbi:ABC transporter permease [Alteromonas sp. a30]|uniref:ABC transporter permease n=1 Tax=Alteromonas sp. a30 TaxID=2730917 RepID=UPI00227DA21E|nr:FtsX-like permease family protein [Alteromonas sp. a30]MCY7295215.1 FtsX-like permease family protein [Alteromonas sp. a30]
MLLSLSIRNLFRHRWRFLINILVVMVASCLLVVALGQIGGINRTLTQSVTNTLTGHLVIKPESAPVDFFQFTSSKKLPVIATDDVGKVLSSIKSQPFVEAASERVRFGSLIGDDNQSEPAMIIAVNPETEGLVCTDLTDIIAPLKNGENAAISSYLSKKTRLSKGESIVVFSETPNDSFNAAEYTLADIVNTPVLIDEFINNVFFINIDTAHELLYLDGEATEIVVRVKPEFQDKETIGALAKQLNASLANDFPELKAYAYFEVETSIENISVIAEGMGVIQVGTIILVMLVTVLILTSITLHERRFEIGTLMSIGMTPGKLTTMFMLEVFLKVVIGYLVGFLLGVAILSGINLAGGIQAANQVDQYIYGGKVMFPVINISGSLLGGLLVIGVSMLVTWTTCHKAGRQNLVSLLSNKK